ncbi:MAG TPA: hypothetical protein VHX92_02025 [Rhizomicrobium sp.]|jgi:hypothetical protein|nr:hypothetical protein [Rhizomicrobium sp.]
MRLSLGAVVIACVGSAAASCLAASPAIAQTLPEATLLLPDTSSKSFDWGLTAGLDYVTGNYGAKCAVTLSITCTTTGTTVFALPVTGMLQIERLRLLLTVPYVDIEGPGRFDGDLGVPVIVAPANNEPKHRSGLGDITVGAAYILLRENLFMPRIELAGTVKLPSAASGLGTGKTDYGAQVNLYRTLLPWLTTFGSLGYEWVGDLNTVKLHSGADATAGVDFKFLGAGGGALLDYHQSAWTGAPDYFTLNPYIRWSMMGLVGVSLYGTVGLTRSSPSQAFGVRFSL